MKRLYRSQTDIMIAGVCAGLADYLSVDVTIVRLVFVLLLFFMSGGFWIYLALWIIMPVAPTASQDSIDVEAQPTPPAEEAPKKIAADSKAKSEPAPKKEEAEPSSNGTSSS